MSADDPLLAEAARDLANKRAAGHSAGAETAHIAELVQHRLADKIAI